MSNPNASGVECDQLHAGLAVADIRAAIDFYVSQLGFTLGFTWGEPPTFAGVNLGNVQIFLSQGTPTPRRTRRPYPSSSATSTGSTSCIAPTASRSRSRSTIAPTASATTRCATLDGYYLSFGQHLFNAGAPIKIERVDVPVRLEKRLAALLRDLAEHKRLSINSTLEEMLLHTNDGVGPHTKSQLRYIEELKKKHGIDYDSHGSYRFVEE